MADLRCRCPATFNVANAVLVLALLLKQGVPLDAACDVMSQVSAPPGRMQRVGHGWPRCFCRLRTYADGLEVRCARCAPIAAASSGACSGAAAIAMPASARKWVGGRALADHVVITDDNPRSEDPHAIIDDIVAGLRTPELATIIEDRAAAIAWAIEHAADDDVILIAGKGHEDYQEIAGERTRFSDYAVAETALAAREGGR